MIITFPIHPAAAKYLIAVAVLKIPSVQEACQTGKIFIGAGTTNIEIAERLLDINIENQTQHVAGVITQQAACSANGLDRKTPWCIEQGKLLEVDWLEFISSFGPGDIFIKGANAVDPTGKVGILLGDSQGGTIGKSIGILKARGIEIITPVGLEKLIPSCTEAEKLMGIGKIKHSLGLKTGYIVLSNTTLITEIQSLKLLFDVEATMVAAGGVGGMEGAVMLAADCSDEEQAASVMKWIKAANRRKPIMIKKNSCSQCLNPCDLKELL